MAGGSSCSRNAGDVVNLADDIAELMEEVATSGPLCVSCHGAGFVTVTRMGHRWEFVFGYDAYGAERELEAFVPFPETECIPCGAQGCYQGRVYP